MTALPSALEQRLSSHSLQAERVLVFNARKDTYTVLARTADSQRRVVKWHGPSAPSDVRAGFQTEAQAYAMTLLPMSPKLLVREADHLILEHVDGVTFRERLTEMLKGRSSIDLIPDLIETVYGQILERHAVSDAHAPRRTPREFLSAIRPVYHSFAASGPMVTRRSRLESAWTRSLALIARPVIEYRLRTLAHESPDFLRSGVTHGDLHLDNILVDDEGHATLIDLANVTPDGIPAVDLLYATAAVLTLLDGDGGLQRDASDRMRSALDRFGFAADATLVGAAQLSLVGRINRRFNPAGPVVARQMTFLWDVARGWDASGARR